MNGNQQLLYLDKNFQILNIEQEFIIHPTALSLVPATTETLTYPYSCIFSMKEYQLMLDSITLTKEINEHTGEGLSNSVQLHYLYDDLAMSYNGTILIGCDLVKEYEMKNLKPTCFSYRNVLELTFEDGVLITTVDQSRAMLRIRKNIEQGLRSLAKSRDVRCIKRFMNSSFVGNYHSFLTPGRRLKFLKELKNEYMKKEVSFSVKN